MKAAKQVQKSDIMMSDSEEDGSVNLPKLYKKAANAKRSLTRAKKELQNALKALSEAAASQHFFEELIKVQEVYRERRLVVLEIYDTIEDEVAKEKFASDFGRQTAEIEKDFDVLEEQARLTISAHHNAVIAVSANISQASVPRGGVTGAPKFKLEASFEPKPPLKIDMTPADVQNWERQFKMYYDISLLKHADIATQRAVLLNCLHTEMQQKVYEVLSGAGDIKEALAVIKAEVKKRHPRVVRRHNLFSLEQKKDEYKFSDTLSRLDTLAKEADLTDMSKDSILCHLILRACRDDNLRTKMLEVDEAEMTVVKLKEVVDRFETIQETNRGLGEKEKVKRTKAGESNICYRCQGRGHFASNCTVPEKSLFCLSCSENGVPLPHAHNSFPGCKGRKKEESKKKEEDEKGGKSEKEVSTTKRARARDGSPAGEPESSDSEDERVQARRVKMIGDTDGAIPAGSASSADNEEEEEDDTMMDSGWASDWASSTEEEEEEEDYVPFSNNNDFEHMKVRGYKAADPVHSRPPAENRSPAKADPPQSSARGGQPEQSVSTLVRERKSGHPEMQCKMLGNPMAISAIIMVVLVMLVGGFSEWAGSTDKTTSNMDPVDVRNADKHEISLLDIDKLASSQRRTNGLMIASFVIILLTAVCSFYKYKRNKTERRRVKNSEMMNKIQAVENEMVNHGSMKKKNVKIKVKMLQKKKKKKGLENRNDDNLPTGYDSD